MEGAGEEAIEVTGGGGFLKGGKDGDSSFRTDGCSNMIDTQAVFMSTRDWPRSMTRGFTDALEGEAVNRIVISEQPSGSPSNTSNAGDMVEELILGNYRDSNLVAVANSKGVKEGMQNWQSPKQNLYQPGGGSGIANSRLELKDKAPSSMAGGGEMGNSFLSHIWTQKPPSDKSSNLMNADSSGHLISGGNNSVGVRTKLLSSSGFSQFFIKNSLKGKGVVRRDLEVCHGYGSAEVSGNEEKATSVARVAPDAKLSLGAKDDNGSGITPNMFQDGISLREWMRPGCRKVNRTESLYIFRQIVELVDLAHSLELALQDLRPSCVSLLSSNQVKYMGPLAERELLESAMNAKASFSGHHSGSKRLPEVAQHPGNSRSPKHRKLGQNILTSRQQLQFLGCSGYKSETVKCSDAGRRISGHNTGEQHKKLEIIPQSMFGSQEVFNTQSSQIPYMNVKLEEKWYTSPEELNERRPSFSSNVYSLGILLFELFCCFESWEVHAAAMLDLRHRILPPNFLSEYPKEAGFCLWLLHPEPSSRPSTREILQSELICELQDFSSEDQLSSTIDEDYAESELLLHFLLSLKEQKQQQASKLVGYMGCLDTDISEVQKRQPLKSEIPCKAHDSFYSFELGSLHKESLHPEVNSRMMAPVSSVNRTSIYSNINQLEIAYFSMRNQVPLPDSSAMIRADRDLLKNRERWFPVQNENDGQAVEQPNSDPLGMFFDGLCKYARYSKFEVRGILRNGDLLNSANVICSLSFDRDEEYIAAAGVSKKIKIFGFNALLNDSVDIHYPVIEMSSRSKLSCVCWNSYIKNYLASTDYDGVVQLWDASTSQGFSQYTDHERRAWSVDFSPVDPTMLASGSDDCSVKLWTISERRCIGTIRNVANVCCVQFSSHSTHLLAFGSADYQTYCYDLRNTRTPWCKLTGHGKAVSYVKFIDHETLISASTDNTLKLWDLNKTNASGLSPNACSLTFKGHTNEKNFVGLSVSDGYIACGSETNEVYAYYKSLPMPITSHKFGSVDPISGRETSDDGGQFVSSVCWKGKSDMVVSANSSGSIKLLQMV